MGLMDRLMGEQRPNSSPADYVELDIDDFETTDTGAGTRLHVAKINGQRDAVAIKNAVYDGDIVVADITPRAARDRTIERVSEDLQQVVREVGGDIVQKDDDQLIITPSGVTINRKRLGQ